MMKFWEFLEQKFLELEGNVFLILVLIKRCYFKNMHYVAPLVVASHVNDLFTPLESAYYL